jgi:thiol-disulfide isomerase/thioredoxin
VLKKSYLGTRTVIGNKTGVKMKKGLLLSILITLLAISSCSGGKDGQSSEDDPDNRTPMPAFVLKDLDGNEVNSDDYRGKVLMLNFWAIWCGPCIAEIPDLNEIYETNRDRKFELLAIASQSGNAAAVNGYVERLGIEFPVVMGEDRVLQQYGVFAFPTDFIIDKRGFVREHILGAPPGKKDQLQTIIDKLLEE